MKLGYAITRRWFRSIIVIVGAILVVSLFLCLYFMREMHKNILQVSSDMTSYMQQSVDSRLDEIQKSSILFELNTVNTKIKQMKQRPTEVTQEIYEFCDQLNNFRISSKLIKNVFIYYPNIDYIAGDLGFYPSDSYYALMNFDKSNVFNEWRPTLTNTEKMRFVFVGENEYGSLLYVREMNYGGALVGIIIVEINSEELLRSTKEIGKEAESLSTFGIFVDNQRVISSGEMNSQQAFEIEEMDFPPQQGTLKTGEITAYIRASKYPKLWYIAGYYQKKMFGPIYTAAVVSAVGILLCFLLGIIYSLKISRQNARPLVHILEKLPGQNNEKQDEYHYITTKIDQLLHDRFKNEEKLQEQQSMIESLFLNIVLRGEIQEEYAAFSAAKRYDVLFENPIYQVAVFEAGGKMPEKILEKAIEACQGQHQEVLATILDEKLVVLFNLEAPLEENIASRIAKAVFEALPETSTCGFGLGYDNMVNIYTSHGEALAVLPQPAQGQKNAMGFAGKSLLKSGTARQQGLAAMEQFTRNLCAGQYEKAKEAVPGLFADYFSQKLLPVEFSRRMIALQNLMMDEVEKQKIAGVKLSFKAGLENLQLASSTAALQEHTEAILDLLMKAGQEEMQEPGSVPERAKKIIQQNLTDPMLGLYMISDQLKVSNTYLSTSFKAKFGVGVVQYINELRIEQAKDLILTTNMNIKEIAVAVGFTSDINFIRVFKKYEEKTPSALRKATDTTS